MKKSDVLCLVGPVRENGCRRRRDELGRCARPRAERREPCSQGSMVGFFSSRRRHTMYIGDWSSDVCSSDLSSPYSLGCGGTKLIASGTKIASEVVWNEGKGSGGGGGGSAMNPLPAWQLGIVPPSVNPGHAVGRGVPDVCGDADPATGYQIVLHGKTIVVGGTSAVAPLWAALLARINQKLGKPVGYFNPLLYSKLGTSGAFNDIVKGNNDTTGHVGGYAAGKGWDCASGWGSPNGAPLLKALGG